MYNPSSWSNLSEELRQEILLYTKEYGAWKASEKYHEAVGVEKSTLYQRLKETFKSAGIKTEEEIEKGKRKYSDPDGDEKSGELSKEEEIFLERVKNGDVSLEESSRKIAGIVFEKMMRHPEHVKFDAFFKTKLLELKQTEVQDRNNQALTLINSMFNGHLPPKICPKCGYVLYQEIVAQAAIPGTIVEGELADD